MHPESIPFVRRSGIRLDGSGRLTLPDAPELRNHLGTLHAGALYTLAETTSGLALWERFPELRKEALPVLREGRMKHRRPTVGEVRTETRIDDSGIERFLRQWERRGAGLVTVEVALIDADGECCATGAFSWFVGKRSGAVPLQ